MSGWLQRRFRHEVDFWSTSTALLALLILVPLAAVLVGLGRTGPEWSHIAETVLNTYVLNTLVLIATVSVLSLLMALPTAWLVAAFEFPGRRFFEWALILPLAIPTYVAAFAYMKVPEAAIPLLVGIRNSFGPETYVQAELLLRYGLLSLLLAGVLYPYVFISARASFSRQQGSVIEAAQILGRRPGAVFLTIALPLARPAIVAGLSLTIMEVVNDYGAVHFFGVPTLTEGIFRTWFGLGDRASAVRLAGIVMVVIFVFLVGERLQRGRARFAEDSTHARPLARRRLSPGRGVLATLLCLGPLCIGFLIPFLQLLYWAFGLDGPRLLRSWQHLGNSMWLSLATAAVVTLIALVFAYAWKLHNVRWLRTLGRLATMGYAVPGAVVALGVMLCLGWLDERLSGWGGRFGLPVVFLSGTVLAIGFAYVVRFLAVSFQPMHAGMERICGSLDEASRVLGKPPLATLWRVNLPLLRGTMLAALMLVFVDILKELPLTLILRPANFETLATIAFGMASEGRIQESALPSLLIILLGATGLMLLNRFMAGSAK
ncbi:MAG TPA: iron ABC transporter permease [Verrucomicrobiae bacterium]|nr:iron ABC transporter permease [Verrucomicrobiae bacterium]